MDFSGQIVLVYLEEDNTQRSYFRIRPLLTKSGAVSLQDIAALPDDGFLRIVPDKNEQHTFKERMRELGSLCVLNLKDILPDTNKIRSNKNYSPANGETNQFIVYSDAVQGLPPSLLYEVVATEEGAASRLHSAETPMAYTRSGGRIYGPCSRATGLPNGNAALLPPDSEGLYAVTLPNGQEKLFYWPQNGVQLTETVPVKLIEQSAAEEKEKASSAHTELQTENTAESKAAEPAHAQTDKKLSGTPLYQTVAKRAVPLRAYNPLSEIVEQQVRINKAEVPGTVLPANTALRDVENPMDTYKQALNALWLVPEMQKQAVSGMMGMTGVQPLLVQALSSRGNDAVIAAMHSQLQDLEAERLTALVQLDEAKKSLNAIRKDALEQATRDEAAELNKLKKDTEAARIAIDQLEGRRAELLRERDEVLAQVCKAEQSFPRRVRLAPPLGGECTLNALCGRVTASFRARGLSCSWDDAYNLLLLYALCPQVQLCAVTMNDALSAADAFAKALGAAFAFLMEPGSDVTVYEGGDAPVITATVTGEAAVAAYSRFIIGGLPVPHPSGKTAYALQPWPAARIRTSEALVFESAPLFQPVKASSVRSAVLAEKTTISQPVVSLLASISKALENEGIPLPQSVRGMIMQYISAAAPHMEGGIATAVDFAVCAWILPHVYHYSMKPDSIRGLIGGLVRSLEWISL